MHQSIHRFWNKLRELPFILITLSLKFSLFICALATIGCKNGSFGTNFDDLNGISCCCITSLSSSFSFKFSLLFLATGDFVFVPLCFAFWLLKCKPQITCWLLRSIPRHRSRWLCHWSLQVWFRLVSLQKKLNSSCFWLKLIDLWKY